MDWRDLESFSFGDSPALADELASLVLAGTKTATCWAASGWRFDLCRKANGCPEWTERPLAIIETVGLAQRRFSEVDAAFAHDEGEGDRSLAYWREAHRRYFNRLGQFAEDMLLYCERFRVVERIGDDRNADAQPRSSS